MSGFNQREPLQECSSSERQNRTRGGRDNDERSLNNEQPAVFRTPQGGNGHQPQRLNEHHSFQYPRLTMLSDEYHYNPTYTPVPITYQNRIPNGNGIQHGDGTNNGYRELHGDHNQHGIVNLTNFVDRELRETTNSEWCFSTSLPSLPISNGRYEDYQPQVVNSKVNQQEKQEERQAEVLVDNPVCNVRISTWECVEGDLQDCIQECGFGYPTPIQCAAIPHICHRCDVMVHAPAGEGKTIGALIAILQRVKKYKENVNFQNVAINPIALILLPTNELAQHTFDQLRSLSRMMAITSHIETGEDSEATLDTIFNNCDILVGTCERILELMNRELLVFDHLDVLMIDSASLMFPRYGREEPTIKQITGSYKFLKAFDGVQVIIITRRIFKKLTKFADKIMKPMKGEIHAMYVHYGIREEIPRVSFDHPLWSHSGGEMNKMETFANTLDIYDMNKFYLGELEQAIVFTNSEMKMLELQNYLQFSTTVVVVSELNSMNQNKEIIRLFEEGTYRIIITTDKASVGVEMPVAPKVVHFDLPDGNAVVAMETFKWRCKFAKKEVSTITSRYGKEETVNYRLVFFICKWIESEPYEQLPTPEAITKRLKCMQQRAVTCVKMTKLALEKARTAEIRRLEADMPEEEQEWE
ncbi:unnamed protein product [Caenorhabditis sp. 36 PRJEB53466]|nr:unnamed protein product [Caenorhabditis sp. 36 PRJEB53466]